MVSSGKRSPSKFVVALGAELVKYQVKKQLGDGVLTTLAAMVSQYAGESMTDKLAGLLNHGGKAQQLLDAFQDADSCFADKCSSPEMRQAIAAKPLRALTALEGLARSLPDTLDDDGLLRKLRDTFKRDWPNWSQERLDEAAVIYRDCLDTALAAKCDQLLPTLFRKVERIEETTTKTLAGVERLIEMRGTNQASLEQAGLARGWLRPVPARPSGEMVGRTQERQHLKALLVPGVQAAVSGLAGVGKTLLAETLAAELDGTFQGGVLFERLGAGFRSAELANPILNRWGALAFNGQRPKGRRPVYAGRGQGAAGRAWPAAAGARRRVGPGRHSAAA